MSGTGRLSLRARLLIMLIAVTALFLVIMGGASVLVLGRRLGAQFDAQLVAEAERTPRQLASNSGDLSAVEVSLRPRSISPLTGDSAATRELLAEVRDLIASGAAREHVGGPPFAVHLPGQPRLRAVARVIRPQRPGRPVGVLVVARPVAAVAGQVRGILVTELITGGVLLALLALGGRWLIGRGLAPLRQMASAAHRIASRGDLSARMPDADESTEVGQLGRAINMMLEQIQQAFGARLRSEQAVRQFAADASHELRTPLTTIRGYTELYRQGAIGPEQLPDAMRRIESEAYRMSTLVAELLELARLDRMSSLDLAETDLSAVVRDAVADARAVEPARPVSSEAPDHLIAVVDEARIRQILANLLGNVREHTPVTAAVSVRLAQVGDQVLLEVADAGPGMAQSDAARAFDRFYRAGEWGGTQGAGSAGGTQGAGSAGGTQGAGSAGGTQGAGSAGAGIAHGAGGAGGAGGTQGAGSAHGVGGDGTARRMSGRGGQAGAGGGSGLGLSIAQAIARAHGGDATLDSEPGRGVRVRVWLPARPSDERRNRPQPAGCEPANPGQASPAERRPPLSAAPRGAYADPASRVSGDPR